MGPGNVLEFMQSYVIMKAIRLIERVEWGGEGVGCAGTDRSILALPAG